MKLSDIKSETKYTGNSIIIKLNNSYNINYVIVNVLEMKGPKYIKSLNIYSCNKVVTDLLELKNNMSAWKRVRTVNLD